MLERQRGILALTTELNKKRASWLVNAFTRGGGVLDGRKSEGTNLQRW